MDDDAAELRRNSIFGINESVIAISQSKKGPIWMGLMLNILIFKSEICGKRKLNGFFNQSDSINGDVRERKRDIK